MNIKDRGGIYHRAPSVRGKDISEAVSLAAVEEWGTEEENV